MNRKLVQELEKIIMRCLGVVLQIEEILKT